MSIVIFSGQRIIVPLDPPADAPIAEEAPFGVAPDLPRAMRSGGAAREVPIAYVDPPYDSAAIGRAIAEVGVTALGMTRSGGAL